MADIIGNDMIFLQLSLLIFFYLFTEFIIMYP